MAIGSPPIILISYDPSPGATQVYTLTIERTGGSNMYYGYITLLAWHLKK